MRSATPHVEVPGDREDRIMARDGTCMGMNKTLAVWRFGYLKNSPRAIKEECHITTSSPPDFNTGFLWALATRKTGKIRQTWRGFAIELPESFRKVIEWEPK